MADHSISINDAKRDEELRIAVQEEASWALELFIKCYHLDMWAFCKLDKDAGDVVDIVPSTRHFMRMFMMAKMIWRALQQSPRRIISGKKSAAEVLKGRYPKSTLHKFLEHDLGLNDERMDDFRRCENMEQVILTCPSLKLLADQISELYDANHEAIELNRRAVEAMEQRKSLERGLVSELTGAI